MVKSMEIIKKKEDISIDAVYFERFLKYICMVDERKEADQIQKEFSSENLDLIFFLFCDIFLFVFCLTMANENSSCKVKLAFQVSRVVCCKVSDSSPKNLKIIGLNP